MNESTVFGTVKLTLKRCEMCVYQRIHADDVLVEKWSMDEHVHHMIDVVQKQQYQHVMMEIGKVQHQKSMHEKVRDVMHVLLDVQVEQ